MKAFSCKSIVGFLVCFLVIFSVQSNGYSAVAIESKAATGVISTIYDDESIILTDDGPYYPSRPGLVSEIKKGDVVTLLYTEENDRRVFFAIKIGIDSLSPQQSKVTEQKSKSDL